MWGWAQVLAFGKCSPLKLLEVSCGSRMRDRHGGLPGNLERCPIEGFREGAAHGSQGHRGPSGGPHLGALFVGSSGSNQRPESKGSVRGGRTYPVQFIPGAVSQEVTKVKGSSFKFALGSNPCCTTYLLCDLGPVASPLRTCVLRLYGEDKNGTPFVELCED